MLPTTWFEALYTCQQQGQSYVLITVLQSAGSTPRESGCKMVVTVDSQFDTIGGGHLEFEAINTARKLLVANQQTQELVSYPLASKLGQCCGGAVKLLFEAQVSHYQQVAIFGAGHVANALVPLLAQLPLQILWADSREGIFQNIAVPQNVNCIVNDDLTEEIEHLPVGSWVVILTHNHQLDYELVEASLQHQELDFIGMIGSDTKAKRFRARLAHKGFTSAQIERLTSPIGDLAIPGKRPIEVSVSISAQLIRLLHKPVTDDHTSISDTKKLTVETI